MNMANNVPADPADVVLVVGYPSGKVYAVGPEDSYMPGSYPTWLLA